MRVASIRMDFVFCCEVLARSCGGDMNLNMNMNMNLSRYLGLHLHFGCWVLLLGLVLVPSQFFRPAVARSMHVGSIYLNFGCWSLLLELLVLVHCRCCNLAVARSMHGGSIHLDFGC